VQVLEELQKLDLRMDRLRLSGNAMEAKGLAKVTECIWNCPDALLEVDLADNQVEADPDAGESPGSDGVSALLRCLYNHAGYPKIVTAASGTQQVLPLVLRLGGNKVKAPARLLKYIEAKGSKEHVKFVENANAYDHVGKEFLSVCLPSFLEQAVPAEKERRERKRRRDRSGSGDRGAVLKPLAEKEKTAKSEKKAKKSKKAKAEEPEHWSAPKSASPERGEKQEKVKKSKKAKAAKSPANKSRSPSASAGAGAKSSPTPGLRISEEEQKKLQDEVGAKLESFGGLSTEEASRDMLSEFVVCMAVASKPSEEIHHELEAFIGDEAASAFVKWFTKRMKKRT